MVRQSKATESKKSVGRARKASSRTEKTPKRRIDKSESEEEPQLKKQKSLKISHAFETLQSGVVLVLGQGEFGQLGLGEDIVSRKKPALVSREIAGKKIKKVIAGGMHTVCLTEDHKVYTFGCNDEGSLGREISDDSEEFEPGLVKGVIENIDIIDISAGDSHTAALSDDGTVYLWGCFRDSHGRLGLVNKQESCKVPVKLETNKQQVTKIDSGCDHVAMLTENGQVLTVGCGEQGQLGRVGRYFLYRGEKRTPEQLYLRPKVVALPRAKGKRGKTIAGDIYCGSYSTYVISTLGDVFACGLNNFNQLGIPDETGRYVLEHIQSLSDRNWKMMAGGQHHLVLLNNEGHVFTMGRGTYGRLGLGEDVTLVNKPTKVEGLKDIIQVAAGPCVSFAVDSHGDAYGWGMGTNLQLTTGEEDDEWSPVKLSGKNLEERSVVAAVGGGQHTVLLACDKSDLVNGRDKS